MIDSRVMFRRISHLSSIKLISRSMAECLTSLLMLMKLRPYGNDQVDLNTHRSYSPIGGFFFGFFS